MVTQDDSSKSSYDRFLHEAFDAVVESDEIRGVDAPLELLRPRLESRLEENRSELLSQVSEQIAEIERLDQSVKAKRAAAKAGGASGLYRGLASAVVVASLLLPLLFVVLVGLAHRDVPLAGLEALLSQISTARAIGFAGGTLFVLVMFWGWLGKQSHARIAARIASREDELGVGEDELKRERAVEGLEKQLRHEVVLPFLRETIRDLDPPPDTAHLGQLDRTGLVEVHDLRFQIGTTARRRLAALIDEMRGGTVGVSGSRGAGKTTLLRYFCRPDLPETPLEQRRLRVSVSAPVEYEARDFVLHLFSEACYELCELLGVERSVFLTPVEESTKGATAGRRKRRWRLGWRLTATALALGAVVLWTLAGMGLAQELSGPAATPAPSTNAAAASSEAAEDRSADPSGESGTATPATQRRSQEAGLRTFLIDNKKPLFHYGLLLALLAVATPWAFRHLTEGGWSGRRLRHWDRLRLSAGLDSREAPWDTLGRCAVDHLENIHFQQSYSSGWKGSLKLPVLSADRSVTESLSARQQSLPDIIGSFRDFIEKLPFDKPAIVAIDELDKMESPEQAERFLNDIKSIFGIRKCTYLVSVSEQAMARFQRRGLPFRDAFDSSFDEMVHVPYFDLEQSTRLLNRRVIGLPPVFHGLCHLLSGGLARDLIRSCRMLLTTRDSITESSEETVELGALCREMVKAEVQSKIDALLIELHAATPHDGTTDLVARLLSLKEQPPSAAWLLDNAGCLGRWPGTPESNGDHPPGAQNGSEEREGEDPAERVAGHGHGLQHAQLTLVRALGTYLYFLATVLELMQTPPEREHLKPDGVIDKLAGTRPTLGIDSELAWFQVTGLRRELGLETT